MALKVPSIATYTQSIGAPSAPNALIVPQNQSFMRGVDDLADAFGKAATDVQGILIERAKRKADQDILRDSMAMEESFMAKQEEITSRKGRDALGENYNFSVNDAEQYSEKQVEATMKGATNSYYGQRMSAAVAQQRMALRRVAANHQAREKAAYTKELIAKAEDHYLGMVREDPGRIDYAVRQFADAGRTLPPGSMAALEWKNTVEAFKEKAVEEAIIGRLALGDIPTVAGLLDHYREDISSSAYLAILSRAAAEDKAQRTAELWRLSIENPEEFKRQWEQYQNGEVPDAWKSTSGLPGQGDDLPMAMASMANTIANAQAAAQKKRADAVSEGAYFEISQKIRALKGKDADTAAYMQGYQEVSALIQAGVQQGIFSGKTAEGLMNDLEQQLGETDPAVAAMVELAVNNGDIANADEAREMFPMARADVLAKIPGMVNEANKNRGIENHKSRTWGMVLEWFDNDKEKAAWFMAGLEKYMESNPKYRESLEAGNYNPMWLVAAEELHQKGAVYWEGEVTGDNKSYGHYFSEYVRKGAKGPVPTSPTGEPLFNEAGLTPEQQLEVDAAMAQLDLVGEDGGPISPVSPVATRFKNAREKLKKSRWFGNPTPRQIEQQVQKDVLAVLSKHQGQIRGSAAHWDANPQLVASLIMTESEGNFNAVGPPVTLRNGQTVQAFGGGQYLVDTWRTERGRMWEQDPERCMAISGARTKAEFQSTKYIRDPQNMIETLSFSVSQYTKQYLAMPKAKRAPTLVHHVGAMHYTGKPTYGKHAREYVDNPVRSMGIYHNVLSNSPYDITGEVAEELAGKDLEGWKDTARKMLVSPTAVHPDVQAQVADDYGLENNGETPTRAQFEDFYQRNIDRYETMNERKLEAGPGSLGEYGLKPGGPGEQGTQESPYSAPPKGVRDLAAMTTDEGNRMAAAAEEYRKGGNQNFPQEVKNLLGLDLDLVEVENGKTFIWGKDEQGQVYKVPLGKTGTIGEAKPPLGTGDAKTVGNALEAFGVPGTAGDQQTTGDPGGELLKIVQEQTGAAAADIVYAMDRSSYVISLEMPNGDRWYVFPDGRQERVYK